MILITGATGFIGEAIHRRLAPTETVVYGRRAPVLQYSAFYQGDITPKTDYSNALLNVEVVIHAAARVHMMNDDSKDPLLSFRYVNTDGTLNLAEQAAKAGVKRFIFISSIKVNGEHTTSTPFKYDDNPAPSDPYGQSKAEAEEGLMKIAKKTGMAVVIIRPPLVYGPGVKANFASMISIAKMNLPLPFGAIHNKRSLVALDNLVDLVITCVSHPKAKNQIFLVSDDSDVSTTELLTMLTYASGKKPRLLPVPAKYIELAARLLGKKQVADRILSSLQLDITHTKTTLNWLPPVSMHQAISACMANKQ
jgi:UDP-glucose 4-epimerase